MSREPVTPLPYNPDLLTPIEVAQMIIVANGVATTAHDGQVRKGNGEPYINHPYRVAWAVRHHGLYAYLAGLLHDAVEDSDITLAQLREMFPDEVVDAVDSVTRREGEQYFDMIRRARKHGIGNAIKYADNLDNSRNLDQLEPHEAKFLAARYEKARNILNGVEK